MGFAADIEAFAEKAQVKVVVVLKRTVLQGLIGVVRRSPVRFGVFRNAWNVGVGERDGSIPAPRDAHSGPDRGDEATGEEIALAEEALNEATWDDTLFLTNNMPYAQALEDGSSAQTEHQPDGILGETIDELEAHNAQLIAEVSRL